MSEECGREGEGGEMSMQNGLNTDRQLFMYTTAYITFNLYTQHDKMADRPLTWYNVPTQPSLVHRHQSKSLAIFGYKLRYTLFYRQLGTYLSGKCIFRMQRGQLSTLHCENASTFNCFQCICHIDREWGVGGGGKNDSKNTAGTVTMEWACVHEQQIETEIHWENI